MTNETCPAFGVCGGCAYNSEYSAELELKEKTVAGMLEQAWLNDYKYCGIVPSKDTRYRNKMEFSFGDDGKEGRLTLGMRKKGSFYEAVNADNCLICHEDFNKIVEQTREFFISRNEYFYHRKRNTGALRNLVVRKGFFTGEIMVNIVTSDNLACDLSDYAQMLLQIQTEGKIVSVIHTVNNSPADAVKNEDTRLLYGQNYFTEKLLGLQFKISPFSFFQTNSEGAERLYKTVVEFAGDVSNKTVFDLYCGTGTISQLIAGSARKVIGIELVEEAVSAARENAELNNVRCEFIAGNVLTAVDGLDVKPDVIVIDPPREGIHPKAIGKIIGFGADVVVYVSCKPKSLANDLKIFTQNGYSVEAVKCHDMFPRTENIETVVRLVKAADDLEHI